MQLCLEERQHLQERWFILKVKGQRHSLHWLNTKENYCDHHKNKDNEIFTLFHYFEINLFCDVNCDRFETNVETINIHNNKWEEQMLDHFPVKRFNNDIILSWKFCNHWENCVSCFIGGIISKDVRGIYVNMLLLSRPPWITLLGGLSLDITCCPYQDGLSGGHEDGDR